VSRIAEHLARSERDTLNGLLFNRTTIDENFLRAAGRSPCSRADAQAGVRAE
jgi:hypothetical protein